MTDLAHEPVWIDSEEPFVDIYIGWEEAGHCPIEPEDLFGPANDAGIPELPEDEYPGGVE
jgi:hypothetical protein